MGSVKISDMGKAVKLISRVMKAADFDKNKGLDPSEVGRVKIRDNFVTRNVIRGAISNAGHDVTINGAVRALEAAVRSAARADTKGDKDGLFDSAEAQKASRLARNLAKFTELHGKKKVSDFKVAPAPPPDRKEIVALAKGAYETKLINSFGPLAVPVASLPAAVRARAQALGAAHPGRLEAARSVLTRSTVYYAHVVDGRRTDVLVLDPRGRTLASGFGTERSGRWSVSWN